MGKLDRLLLILNLLRSRRNLTASDLAKECEVSERTIYRDIQVLSEARVPVYFDEGYKLLTDAFLPPLNLTADEFLILYVGLNSSPVQSVHCFRKSAKQALAKFESMIPDEIKLDYENAKDRVKFQTDKTDAYQGAGLIFDLLRQAIWPERKIKLLYVSPLSSEEVELVPKSLLLKKGYWYLLGQVQNRTRYFRLDLIKNVSFSS
jgi:predicted DNA-binding transcriptional regulator YafY